jgi:hypothetical protein
MRAQSAAGAIYIPAQYLEVVSYQMVKGTLCSNHNTQMLSFAVRHYATNANLVKIEGLRMMGVAQSNIAVG